MPLDGLDPEERIALCELLEQKERLSRQRLFFDIYPDETVHAPDGSVAELWNELKLYGRSLYPKHLEFFRAGAIYQERAAICGNRIGKTTGMGAFETTAHLTGLYPDWWEGRRFAKPVRWWAAGKTNETTRDIVQKALLGENEGSGPTKRLSGTGMVPGWLLDKPKWKQGSPDLVDTIKVKHATGDWSTLGLKSYEQGRGAFEGTAQHGIWLDEEPPEDVWMECLTRTATTEGMVYGTFTPMEGMSDVALLFHPTEIN
jgi:phage terminase large subunit-like protein